MAFDEFCESFELLPDESARGVVLQLTGLLIELRCAAADEDFRLVQGQSVQEHHHPANESDDVHEEASEESKELNEEVQSIEIAELSERGKRLAKAYRRSVRSTGYVKDRWTTHSSVPAAVLKEFGSRGGLCEISQKGAE